MHNKVNTNVILAVLFSLVVGFIFIMNLPQLCGLAKLELKAIIVNKTEGSFLGPSEVESSYNSNFYRKLDYIDINGIVHKLMGQKIVNGTIKAQNNKLFLEADKNFIYDKKAENNSAMKAIDILKEAEKIDAEVLYVQRPHKFDDKRDILPYGMSSQYNKQFDLWCKKISDAGIRVLDLRESMEDELEFYLTDHHWSIESSFLAAKSIVSTLNEYGEKNSYNEHLFETDNYQMEKYKDSFLGSEGVKTGQYYVGKDDFNILIPEFDTDLEYRHYINNEITHESAGEFWETFIDEDLLNNEDYYNKYNACLYGGYVENIILNNNCENGQKLLLISDSFSRPMVMYLSLAFEETRYLDPQKGRYNESYIKYIKEYQPDVVIMMYTGEFQEQ